MSERISPKRFHEIGWRMVRDEASTHLHSGSFGASLSLAEVIGRQADGGSQQPDMDLRSTGVTVRLRCDTEGRFSEDDLTLARRISTAARDLGASVDLTGLQTVQVAIDALVIPEVMPFWRAVLGYR
jgi:4a-hydroxytetrahydrobiopterin dehydratase